MLRVFQLPGELSLNTCQMYLEDLMMSKGRSLTDNQKTLITRSLRNQPTMLLLNSLANQASQQTLRSYFPFSEERRGSGKVSGSQLKGQVFEAHHYPCS